MVYNHLSVKLPPFKSLLFVPEIFGCHKAEADDISIRNTTKEVDENDNLEVLWDILSEALFISKIFSLEDSRGFRIITRGEGMGVRLFSLVPPPQKNIYIYKT